MRKSIYVLPLLLWACQPQPTSSPALSGSPTAQSLSLNSIRRNYPALTKYPSQGQLHFEGNQLQLRLELYPAVAQAPDFRTQLLDLNSASHLYATVTDSHGKSYSPNGADGNGAVSYSGGTITLTFDDIVPDDLLLVEVQAKDGSSDIVQADLATVLKHTAAASNPGGTINFQTTVAAKAMKSLLASDAGRARAIDLSALETLTTSITGVSGTAPNLSYGNNHPSLVNTAQLATDLQGQDPGDLTAADYRQSGATVNLTVSGLQNTDTLQVQITDAASAVLMDLGNGSHSIAGVTPGAGLEVRATSFGTPGITYNYTVTPSTINPGEGDSIPVTIAAAPALEVSGFSPAAGAPGTSVTINGTGFTGATAVTIGGASASFSVVNDTQITATVPATAVDGGVSVTNTITANSASAFDVYRRIYVNDDASGSNTGTTWANAYTSLQDALTASGANDEIWIAAGTYTPHASDRTVSFQMKENVNMYGGFAGIESALGDRSTDLNDFVTVLSGDLTGNDNYTTPGTTLDENSYHVTEGANNALLEGVTIQGGKANGAAASSSGGGMYNSGSSSSPTLTHVTFANNSASRGGGMYNGGSSSSPTLTHVTFANNSASSSGGGMYNSGSSSPPTLTHVTFANNSASSSGGGIFNFGTSPTLTHVTLTNNAADQGGGIHNIAASPTLTHVTLANNSASQGGGMYNSGSSPILTHVTLINNSADFGGGMYNITSSPTLTNVAFANNSASQGGGIYNRLTAISTLTNVTFANNSADFGGGMYNSGSPSPLTNTLFYNSTQDDQPLGTTNGNMDVGATDPFVDSANPNGPDGIPMTADDGLRIAAGASAVINQGVTGANVPATDILGNARVGNPEPGAYEFPPLPPPANVLVVKHDATGANDGSSWGNAFTSLQAALAAADGATKNEIWIAEGTYTPHASDRSVSFQMKENVNIYGGFAGTESALGDRTASLTDFVTVLSGDLTGNDNYTTPGTTLDENSYHVTKGANNAILDGVTLQGGKADGASVDNTMGAGIYNNAVSPTLSNIIFSNNSATTSGGGMYNLNASPTLSDVRFLGNSASTGGGIHNNTTSSPTMSHVAFLSNSASTGGGIYNIGNSSPVLNNATFIGNSASNKGGGVYNTNSAPTFKNASFSNNTAGSGGGMYNNFSDPILANMTFSNNTASSGGGLFNFNFSAPVLVNVLFYNSIRESQALDPAQGVIEASSDPFVDSANPLGADGLAHTADDGLRIVASASDVINQGVTGANVPATDILGNARVGNPEPGAYEYLP